MLEKQNGGGAVHGITSLSDLSQAEFESRFLSAIDNQKKTTENKNMNVDKSSVDTNAGIVDWTGIYTTPVKDQVSILTNLPQKKTNLAFMLLLHREIGPMQRRLGLRCYGAD
jgi:hypothetical protein